MSFQPPYRSNNPYTAPTDGPQKFNGQMPTVHFWFKIYCGFSTFFGLLLVALGAFFLFVANSPNMLDEMDMAYEEAIVAGLAYGLTGGAFALLYLFGLFFNRGTAGWVFGIVLIALGLTSCCTIIPCIFLLINWIKVENKRMIEAK